MDQENLGVSLEEWQVADPGTSIDVAALDALITEYKNAEAEWEAQKKITNEKYSKVEELEAKVVAALTETKKSKYFVDGLGTAYLINRYTVRTPKTNHQKELLFKYIEEKYGREALVAKLGVNHNTLQGFYSSEIESMQKEGVASPEIPGLEAPTHEVTLGFRKG